MGRRSREERRSMSIEKQSIKYREKRKRHLKEEKRRGSKERSNSEEKKGRHSIEEKRSTSREASREKRRRCSNEGKRKRSKERGKIPEEKHKLRRQRKDFSQDETEYYIRRNKSKQKHAHHKKLESRKHKKSYKSKKKRYDTSSSSSWSSSCDSDETYLTMPGKIKEKDSPEKAVYGKIKIQPSIPSQQKISDTGIKEKLPSESVDFSEVKEALEINTTSKKSSNKFLRKIEIKISSDMQQTKENAKGFNVKDMEVDLIGKWEPVGKDSLKAFTDLCKTLVEDGKDNKPNVVAEERIEKASNPTLHHPFILKPSEPSLSLSQTVPQNPAQAIQAGTIYQIVGNMTKLQTRLAGDVTSNFPVSSGVQHRNKESGNAHEGQSDSPVFEQTTEKVNISAIISERLKVQQDLKENPFNVKAKSKLQDLDDSIKLWSKAGVKPEQFTGEKTKNILRKEDLEGGYCAWARKDFFSNLQPITNGKGLEMLQNMGWRQGQPLGKHRQGFINPIQLEIRTDRKGLSTVGEDIYNSRSKKKAQNVVDAQGKHPVSALAELCTKKKWILPDYRLIMDSGPSHSKNYMFSVHVNGTDFNPSTPCPNKKMAKAQAALVALTHISGVS